MRSGVLIGRKSLGTRDRQRVADRRPHGVVDAIEPRDPKIYSTGTVLFRTVVGRGLAQLTLAIPRESWHGSALINHEP